MASHMPHWRALEFQVTFVTVEDQACSVDHARTVDDEHLVRRESAEVRCSIDRLVSPGL